LKRVLQMRGNRMVRVKKMKPSTEAVYSMLQMQMDSVINAEKIKVIAFTSVVHFDEKSEYVCNIAKSMILEGKRVLVIDCNLENSKIHRYFGIEMKTFLADEKVHNECSQIIFEVPDIPKLSFVLSSLGLKDSEGVLDIEKIAPFIGKAKEEYDIILIDSPPAGINAEGVKLSVIADGTVIMVQSGKTPRALAKRMKEMLEAVNVTVLGVILGR